MAKPKVFLVDWLAESRELTNALPEISRPPGILADLNEWEPDRTNLEPIRYLLNLVKTYLTDRIGRKKPSAKAGDSYGVFTDDPALTWPLMSKFTEDLGMTFTDAEKRAFVAHNMLGQIMRDGWISDSNRRQLPVQIASIHGESASAKQRAVAANVRKFVDRRSTLAKAIADERGRDHYATAAEVLDRLCGGDVVKEFKCERVFYWKAKGKLVSVGLDRFENIFSEQAPLPKRPSTRRHSTG